MCVCEKLIIPTPLCEKKELEIKGKSVQNSQLVLFLRGQKVFFSQKLVIIVKYFAKMPNRYFSLVLKYKTSYVTYVTLKTKLVETPSKKATKNILKIQDIIFFKSAKKFK